jgi:hypothetical protein
VAPSASPSVYSSVASCKLLRGADFTSQGRDFVMGLAANFFDCQQNTANSALAILSRRYFSNGSSAQRVFMPDLLTHQENK